MIYLFGGCDEDVPRMTVVRSGGDAERVGLNVPSLSSSSPTSSTSTSTSSSSSTSTSTSTSWCSALRESAPGEWDGDELLVTGDPTKRPTPKDSWSEKLEGSRVVRMGVTLNETTCLNGRICNERGSKRRCLSYWQDSDIPKHNKTRFCKRSLSELASSAMRFESRSTLCLGWGRLCCANEAQRGWANEMESQSNDRI